MPRRFHAQEGLARESRKLLIDDGFDDGTHVALGGFRELHDLDTLRSYTHDLDFGIVEALPTRSPAAGPLVWSISARRSGGSLS